MHKAGFWKSTRRWPRGLHRRSDQERQTDRDRALARRLHANFERDLELADIYGIHFYVQNGVVTLYGVVRNELERDLLVSLVRQVPGVKGVVAHLQIVEPQFQDAAPVVPEPVSA
ncbi:BON domain-containing protein [Rhodocaloribacter sp.]